ncbi:MAG: ABC transporter permease subunit, partial [Caldilineaceae bacterium]|nr:ABC transporter permease subunit [Caldilineaceae bacterium]
LGSAFVVTRATDALAGAVETGSAYLLLSRPVPRWALVVGKMGEIAVGAAVIVLAAWLGLWIGAVTTLGGDLPFGRYALVALVAWLLFCALGAGALLISSCTGRTDIAGGLGSAWTLVAFVLDVIPQVANSPIGVLNPWHHYFPQEVVTTGQVDPTSVAVLLGWVLFGTVAAAVNFGRRDLI